MGELQLKGKMIITGDIVTETGMSIGGSKEKLDIGGIDNPVIKDAAGVPYIPGSSLKGKLRSLLERSLYPLRTRDETLDEEEKAELQKASGEEREALLKKFHEKYPEGYFGDAIHEFFALQAIDPTIRLFGISGNQATELPRLIVRDAALDRDHFEENREDLFRELDLAFTEEKMENRIDRIRGAARDPRHMERVPPGARFKLEVIFNVFSDEDEELIGELFKALKLLEDDYLGGSGSRGYGKVMLTDVKAVYRSIGYYEGEEKEKGPEEIERFTLEEAKAVAEMVQ